VGYPADQWIQVRYSENTQASRVGYPAEQWIQVAIQRLHVLLIANRDTVGPSEK